MSQGIASLHKILKDETRQKLIAMLNEKGSLSYSELMTSLRIDSTGRLNYHLKVLGDLLEKNQNGQYSLSEKGKLAYRLLTEFSDKNVTPQSNVRLSSWMVVVGLTVYAIFTIGYLALYVQGIISVSEFLLNELIATGLLGVVLFSYLMNRIGIRISTKPQLSSGKIVSIVFWALVGTCAFMICGSFLLYGFQTLLQSIGVPFVLFPFRWWVIFSFAFGPVLGGYIGYLRYKRHQ